MFERILNRTEGLGTSEREGQQSEDEAEGDVSVQVSSVNNSRNAAATLDEVENTLEQLSPLSRVNTIESDDSNQQPVAQYPGPIPNSRSATDFMQQVPGHTVPARSPDSSDLFGSSAQVANMGVAEGAERLLWPSSAPSFNWTDPLSLNPTKEDLSNSNFVPSPDSLWTWGLTSGGSMNTDLLRMLNRRFELVPGEIITELEEVMVVYLASQFNVQHSRMPVYGGGQSISSQVNAIKTVLAQERIDLVREQLLSDAAACCVDLMARYSSLSSYLYGVVSLAVR